jgi:HK97 family phage prohead protease
LRNNSRYLCGTKGSRLGLRHFAADSVTVTVAHMATPIRLSAAQFKQHLTDGSEVGVDAVLIKDFAPEILKDADGPTSRVVQFVISTGAVDRDGDTINPLGWDLTSYQTCGAVLWGHDASQPPIAEPLAVWVEDGKLKARCRFPTKEVYAFSDTIYQLIQANVLRCTSVGFKPTTWVESDRKDGFMPGLDFQTQTLLEFSVVSVPANPEAIIEAKSLGVELGPYLEWAEKTLDTLHESGLLIPRNALEKTYFAGKGTVSVSVPVELPVTDAKDDATLVVKGGRVLSVKNANRLKQAIECIQDVMKEHETSMSPDDDDMEDEEEPEDEADEQAADVAKSVSRPKDEAISLDAVRNCIADMIDEALSRARGR